mgnify:CR=1 FL=1
MTETAIATASVLSLDPANVICSTDYNVRIPKEFDADRAGYIGKLLEDKGPHGVKFRELVESVKAKGQLQTAGVTKTKGGKWALTMGWRRLMACQHLGIEVKAVEQSYKNTDAAYGASLDENEKREDLTVSQMREAFERLATGGAKQKDTAKKLGVSDATVSFLKYMPKRLPPDVIALCDEGRLKQWQLIELSHLAKAPQFKGHEDNEEIQAVLFKGVRGLAKAHATSSLEVLRKAVEKASGKATAGETESKAPKVALTAKKILTILGFADQNNETGDDDWTFVNDLGTLFENLKFGDDEIDLSSDADEAAQARRQVTRSFAYAFLKNIVIPEGGTAPIANLDLHHDDGGLSVQDLFHELEGEEEEGEAAADGAEAEAEADGEADGEEESEEEWEEEEAEEAKPTKRGKR